MADELDQEEARRRIKAGRALRGWTVRDLAQAIDAGDRMGESTLRKLEGGENTIQPKILRSIAASMGLPYEFFVLPLAELREALDGRGQSLRRRSWIEMTELLITSLDVDREQALVRLQARKHSLLEEDEPGSQSPGAS